MNEIINIMKNLKENKSEKLFHFLIKITVIKMNHMFIRKIYIENPALWHLHGHPNYPVCFRFRKILQNTYSHILFYYCLERR